MQQVLNDVALRIHHLAVMLRLPCPVDSFGADVPSLFTGQITQCIP